VREFLDLFQEAEREFPERIAPSRRLVLITGTLAEPVLRSRVLPGLNKVRGVEARLAAVENSLFGRTVTVSGLLCGGDILERLKAEEGDYEVLLPSNCLNSEDLFLDDITLEGMRERLGKPVQVIDDFHEIWEKA